MKYYPVFLDLREKVCLVVGGGKVAERKVKTLLDCGTRVKVVSRAVTPWIEEKIREGAIDFAGKSFRAELLDEASLVIAATDSAEMNRSVSCEAKKRKVWCNVVDQPEDCTFILPSIVNRGDLTIAISTSGSSPALARKIREELEKEFGPEFALFIKILGCVRRKVLRDQMDHRERKKIFTSLVTSDMVDRIKNNDWHGVDSLLKSIVGDGYSVGELGLEKLLKNQENGPANE